MTFNVSLEGGGVMVGDRIDIAIEVEGILRNQQAIRPLSSRSPGMSQSLHRIQTWNIGGSGPEVRPTDTRDLNETVQAATTQILLGRARTRFRPDRRARRGKPGTRKSR